MKVRATDKRQTSCNLNSDTCVRGASQCLHISHRHQYHIEGNMKAAKAVTVEPAIVWWTYQDKEPIGQHYTESLTLTQD